MTAPGRALILGGAGFVGSAVTAAFVEAGWTVTVIDSIEPGTFGDAARLAPFSGRVEFIRQDVTTVPDLANRLAAQDVVVNAMGWSRHRDGEQDPETDLRLNLANHIHVLQHIWPGPCLIQLASRHQFAGRTGIIDDDTPFAPLDVQGIHKCATEHHVQRWVRRHGADAAVLRFGNCIGPGQPIADGDMGLIGGFLRDLLAGRTIEVYEGPRVRNVCFTGDLGQIALRLAALRPTGYIPINIPGIEVDIGDLAARLAKVVGRGAIRNEPMPPEVAQIELSQGRFEGSTLKRLLPEFAPTDLDTAIAAAVSGL
jgi:UDP-glucose 4-epimerase